MNSSKKERKPSIFIDALSFAQERKSGVGHIAEEMSIALAEICNREKNRKLYLVVPLGKAKYVRKYTTEMVHIKTIPLPARAMHLLNKLNILPPLDIFLGKGDYIFPNYRNWRLLFSKSFTYIHDLTFYHYGKFVEPKNLAYLQKNIPIWIERSTRILTATHYTKNEIVDYLHVDSHKVDIVPHGVDTKKFYHYRASDRDRILRSYQVPYDNFILYVGNIEPRKNIVGLVKAYALMSKKLQDKYPLLLIGGGGWLNEAEQSVIKDAIDSGLNIIRPDKYVEDSDLPAFYSAAKCVAMPSFYEGFGVPPLQAIACGTPIVVANNSTLREVFSEVGIMVDANNPKNIKAGLEKALMIDSKALGVYRKKAEKLAKTYNWNDTAKKIIDIIEEPDV